MKFLIKKSQQDSFPNELKHLQKRNIIATSSRIRTLLLFLDKSNMENTQQFTSSCKMFTTLMKIPQLSVHAIHFKLTIGLYQLDLKYVKYTTVVMTADASSPMDSNLKCLLYHHVDFHQIFGPFASNNSTTYSKRYGLNFTCMATHAIHLEMCHDRSLQKSALTDFWRDIWSFAGRNSRKGIPSEFRFDNATNFTAAEKKLKTTFDSSLRNQFFGYHQISWKFNPAYEPHFGEVWECLFRSFENSLYAINGSKALTDDTFNTSLCENEQFMNARPITNVSSSPCDIEALTSDHFLLGRMFDSMPPRINSWPLTLKKQWKIAQQLSDHV